MIKLLDVYWNNIIIGYLYKDKDNYYIFKYDKQNLKTAREKGFDYIIGFKNVNKVYKSDSLFAFFTSRVPSKRRKDVLDRIGISEYDEIEILKRTHGKCFTDNYEVR